MGSYMPAPTFRVQLYDYSSTVYTEVFKQARSKHSPTQLAPHQRLKRENQFENHHDVVIMHTVRIGVRHAQDAARSGRAVHPAVIARREWNATPKTHSPGTNPMHPFAVQTTREEVEREEELRAEPPRSVENGAIMSSPRLLPEREYRAGPCRGATPCRGTS